MSRAHIPLLKAGHTLALVIEEMIRGDDITDIHLEAALVDIGLTYRELGLALHGDPVMETYRICDALRLQCCAWRSSTILLSRSARLKHPDLQDMAGSCRMIKRRWREWIQSYEASAVDPFSAESDARGRFSRTHHHPKGGVHGV